MDLETVLKYIAMAIVVIAIFYFVVAVLWLYLLTDKPGLYLFYRMSCPYCVKLMPEWEKTKKMAAAEDINVVQIDVESGDLYEKAYASKMNISSVPCIMVLSPSKKWYKYKGPRDADSMMKFARMPHA